MLNFKNTISIIKTNKQTKLYLALYVAFLFNTLLLSHSPEASPTKKVNWFPSFIPGGTRSTLLRRSLSTGDLPNNPDIVKQPLSSGTSTKKTPSTTSPADNKPLRCASILLRGIDGSKFAARDSVYNNGDLSLFFTSGISPNSNSNDFFDVSYYYDIRRINPYELASSITLNGRILHSVINHDPRDQHLITVTVYYKE